MLLTLGLYQVLHGKTILLLAIDFRNQQHVNLAMEVETLKKIIFDFLLIKFLSKIETFCHSGTNKEKAWRVFRKEVNYIDTYWSLFLLMYHLIWIFLFFESWFSLESCEIINTIQKLIFRCIFLWHHDYSISKFLCGSFAFCWILTLK